MLKDKDFIEITGYLRVLEKRILSNVSIDRITDVSGIAETLRQISQNSAWDFTQLRRPEDSETILRDVLKNVYDEIRSIIPDTVVVDAAAIKHEFHNVRVAVKLQQTQKDLRYLYSDIPALPAPELEDFVSGLDKSENIPQYIEDAVAEAAEAFAESGDVQDIDIVIDRHLFARFLALCDEIGNPFITEYAQLSIDFHNVKTLLRVNNMKKGVRFLNHCLISGGLTDLGVFSAQYDKSPDAIAQAFSFRYFGDVIKKGMDDYSRTGNFSGLERRLDDYLMEHVKKTKLLAFGPEIPFAYLLSKENEARQIRIIIACKLNGIRPEVLRERLRDNYA